MTIMELWRNCNLTFEKRPEGDTLLEPQELNFGTVPEFNEPARLEGEPVSNAAREEKLDAMLVALQRARR